MDQRCLARHQPCQIDQVQPRRHPGLGQRCRFDKAEFVRQAHRQRRIDQRIFGIATAADQCHDPVADREILAADTDRIDFAGHLQPQRFRCARWWRIAAFTLGNVSPVDAGRAHADAQLAGPRFRHRQFADDQGVGITGGGLDDRSHDGCLL